MYDPCLFLCCVLKVATVTDTVADMGVVLEDGAREEDMAMDIVLVWIINHLLAICFMVL